MHKVQAKTTFTALKAASKTTHSSTCSTSHIKYWDLWTWPNKADLLKFTLFLFAFTPCWKKPQTFYKTMRQNNTFIQHILSPAYFKDATSLQSALEMMLYLHIHKYKQKNVDGSYKDALKDRQKMTLSIQGVIHFALRVYNGLLLEHCSFFTWFGQSSNCLTSNNMA